MASPTILKPESPGYVAGNWAVDPVHSEVSFTVRHMMVSKVRGRFNRFEANIRTAENFLNSSVDAIIDLNSIDTQNEQRDAHLRSADFFEIDKYPAMTYRSTGIRPHYDQYVLEGELTLHGVTRPVQLALEANGFTRDPYGNTRAGFTATGEISRRDFGVDINLPMDGGGAVVGDKVQINIEIEAVLQAE
jgi:polyisoprenoid-binding protein YceI